MYAMNINTFKKKKKKFKGNQNNPSWESLRSKYLKKQVFQLQSFIFNEICGSQTASTCDRTNLIIQRKPSGDKIIAVFLNLIKKQVGEAQIAQRITKSKTP